MNKRKIVSLLLGLCLLMGLFTVPVQKAAASEVNESILEARKGILQVITMIKVDGVDRGVFSGTGFLLGGDDGAQTVITNYHVIHSYTDDQLRAMLELDENAKIEYEVRIIVKRDVYIGATVVNESEIGDFSILKMEQPIYDRTPLTLGDSSSVVTTQEIFALGFPGIVQDIQVDEIYNSDDVTVTSGIVSKTSDVALVGTIPIPCITHSARLAEGNSGGPLVDKNGYVIGVNTIISNDDNNNNDYFFSTQINEIREVLDALGIEYKSADSAAQASAGGAGTEPEAPQTAPADTQTPAPEPADAVPQTEAPAAETENPLLPQLKKAIDSADSVVLDTMTKESAENFRSALNAAEAVYRDVSASDSDIQKAISDLETAKNGLVENSGPNMTLILLIAAAVVVVIIVVIIIIVVSRSKKNAEHLAEQKRKQQIAAGAGGGAGAAAGAQGSGATGWNQQRPQGNLQQPPQNNFQQPFTTGSDGSTETSVLNDGAGETTVLGGGSSIPQASIIRKKNNERITITKQVFKVGKERRRVDYCISDNSNVSRTHADIVFKNGSFYVIDNNATNGTTVNGAAVSAGQERRLSDGDIIKFADEEFRFQM